MSDETDYSLSYRDKMAVEEHEKLSPRLVYEIIRRSGVEELQRPTKSLIYSGITAGLVISFSFFFKAVLTSLLPSNTVWTPLIANMGYTVGFIIVILGHMQLFTENTITTVVPLFRPFSWQKLGQVGRLWGIVFASNLVGTAIAAAFLLNTHLLNPEVKVALDAIATHVAHMSAMENIVRGIPAGILIASLVWMMPSSSSKLGLIFFMIYLIALGDFTHVIVGSAEMAYLLYQGQVGIGDYLFTFLLPTALGNILGGTGVFTLLVYGQVNNELN